MCDAAELERQDPGRGHGLGPAQLLASDSITAAFSRNSSHLLALGQLVGKELERGGGDRRGRAGRGLVRGGPGVDAGQQDRAERQEDGQAGR